MDQRHAPQLYLAFLQNLARAIAPIQIQRRVCPRRHPEVVDLAALGGDFGVGRIGQATGQSC